MQSTDPTPPLTTSNSTTTSNTSTPGPPTPNAGQKGKCTKDHVRYCMDVLAAHFEGREPMRPGFSGVNDKFAMFVTWNTTRPGHEPRLRGCIGTFTPMPLADGLKEYALISALKDHRFNPISATELPTLQCGISILTPTTPISDPLAWTPGIHGIQISFPSPSTSSSSSSSRTRRLSATYLPEIATDQGWSQEETILSAIQKAGYRGRVVVGDEVWRSLEVGVYESSKAKLDWSEYEAWRAGRD